MQTKAYKDEMESFAKRLAKERDRMLKALEAKNVDAEDYDTLVMAIDKTTKNIQLLTGGDTERVGGAQQVDELRGLIMNVLIDARGGKQIIVPIAPEEITYDARLTGERSEGVPTLTEPLQP